MTSSHSPSPALTHPRYTPGTVLGRGAQGLVLRVTDRESPDHPLVAKVWLAGRFPEAALQGEFALLGRLTLPSVVRVHDFGRDSLTGAPFLVEDYIAGPDARAFVNEGPSEGRSDRIWCVVRDVLRALVGLHEAGFIHGDLKPAHLKLNANQEVILIDLGSATALALSSTATGTPGYLAPEVLAGAAASIASDLYAVGALAFGIATGELPSAGARGLGARAPWIEPGLARLVESLIASHPRDRPIDAGEALARISASCPAELFRRSAVLLGRERELEELLSFPTPGVRYLSGPSGIGKTQLACEVWIQALLAGRGARRLTFPHANETCVGQLTAFFRGEIGAWPFGPPPHSGAAELLVLDPLDLAPTDLSDALEAFRCRGTELPLHVLGVRRDAPTGSTGLELGPLPDADFGTLARHLGITGADELAAAGNLSRNNPGWLVAFRGGAPVTSEMVRERLDGLSGEARELVACVAVCAGEVSETLLRKLIGWEGRTPPESLSLAFAAGLLVRQVDQDGPSYRLPAPQMAPDLANLLATFEVVDRAARVLLISPDARTHQLLALAQAPCPPARREELLEHAARVARDSGLRSGEIDALLGLLARAERRSVELLLRLERLTRDAGTPLGHPEVHAWLEEASQTFPAIAPLVLRRSAERAARSGEPERADALIAEALHRATDAQDPAAVGFSHASAAAIALYRADWPRAERELALARKLLHGLDRLDAEELARLDHNAGVVDLYAERFPAAVEQFERSLAVKRALGDRSGVRSCLLNLGIALTSIRDFARAERVLVEATLLARSLGQRAGEAWCLTARVELELGRGATEAAERWLRTAETLTDAAPAVVRADLDLLGAEVALANGDAELAFRALSRLDQKLVQSDASLRVKALLVEGKARMLRLPAEPRKAARLAAQALRLARSAQLSALGTRAVELLSRVRRRPQDSKARYAFEVQPRMGSREWDWLRDVGAGLDRNASALALCRLFVGETRAERALVALIDSGGQVSTAFGVDLDGFELQRPEVRIDPGFLRTVLASTHSIHQRDVAGGSRLGAQAAGPNGERVVIVLEHRFRPAHFDALTGESLASWLTLACLVARLPRGEGPAPPPFVAAEVLDTTTRQPLGTLRHHFPEILGKSAALSQALLRLDAAIESTLPVLILGETGSGKELFARALHAQGPRAGRPLVVVNCAAVADSLFEAELFGHVRGAFTGADRLRPGLLAQAEGGTLFLDEIGELSPARQATLLRLLETGQYRSVGSDLERRADVRLVAATNRSLEAEVENGRFRGDLWFRLNVLEIRVPPLRERREDVELFVREFLKRSPNAPHISEAALARLAGYDWPGNVRELQNTIGRLIASGAQGIDLPDLPRAIRAATPYQTVVPFPTEPETSEREQVELALTRVGGNITHAAQALGLTRHGLKKRMLRLGLRQPGARRG